MAEVIRAKTWEQRRTSETSSLRDDKITAEYVRLSEENRKQQKEIKALKLDYDSAMERVCDLEERIKNITALYWWKNSEGVQS